MHYVDPSTGRTYPLSQARWRADSGHYLNLSPGPGLRRADIDPARRSVWRYARALPVEVDRAVSLGEGWTPLLPGEWHGAPAHYKLEFMMPTGSFKDRGTTVLVSHLKSLGVTRVLEDSPATRARRCRPTRRRLGSPAASWCPRPRRTRRSPRSRRAAPTW